MHPTFHRKYASLGVKFANAILGSMGNQIKNRLRKANGRRNSTIMVRESVMHLLHLHHHYLVPFYRSLFIALAHLFPTADWLGLCGEHSALQAGQLALQSSIGSSDPDAALSIALAQCKLVVVWLLIGWSSSVPTSQRKHLAGPCN